MVRKHWKWLRIEKKEWKTRSGTYLRQNMGIISDRKVPVVSDKGSKSTGFCRTLKRKRKEEKQEQKKRNCWSTNNTGVK